MIVTIKTRHSNIHNVTKLEILPNEILIECFQYLNAFQIFYSFDQLNNRFNDLIRYIPLYIDFENVNTSVFNEFCVKMLSDSQIKNQIYSLNLPNEENYLQTKIFLSLLSYTEFSNLQIFETNLSLPPYVSSFETENDKDVPVKIKATDLVFSNLRKLSLFQIYFSWCDTYQTSSISNLTIDSCNLDYFDYLLEYIPMLKYLHINQLKRDVYCDIEKPFNDRCYLYLKQLTISHLDNRFKKFESFLKQTPNLKRLTISISFNIDMIDANQWEQLITSSLSHLNRFEFTLVHFAKESKDNIITKFKQFQSDFWQKQHYWYTEFVISNNLSLIYTIPYSSTWFSPLFDGKRYCNIVKNNVNPFVNVTKLVLYKNFQIDYSKYYFPNVTSITFVPDNLSSSYVAQYSTYINPFHPSYFCISTEDKSSVSLFESLEIFKQTPKLFSLILNWDKLTLFMNNNELCHYLHQKIKSLHIHNIDIDLINNSFITEKFCKIFSNIEHLNLHCEMSSGATFFLLLNRLPKLVNFIMNYYTNNDPQEDLVQWKDEFEKRNAIYNINSDYYNDHYLSAPYFTQIEIWFGNIQSCI